MSALIRRNGTFLLIAFLLGCQGQNADIEPEQSSSLNSSGEVVIPKAPNTGDVLIPDLDNALVTLSVDLSLNEREGQIYSFTAPENSSADVVLTTISSFDSDSITYLNTSNDNGSEPDILVYVDNDSVYSINLEDNSHKQLWHFPQKVCEVLPVEIPLNTVSDNGGTPNHQYSVIHDTKIWVVTASSNSDADPCSSETGIRYYDELDLIYDAEDPTEFAEKTSIGEGLAKSSLINGWKPNASNGYDIAHGYLGYSHELSRIEFYNSDRQLVWYQSRQIESFPTVIDSAGERSRAYLFELTQLNNFEYMLQIGLDLFVFDSSIEVFAQVDDAALADVDSETHQGIEVENVFSDRVLRLDLSPISSRGVVYQILDTATLLQNTDNRLIYNNYKVYSLPAALSQFEPDGLAYTYDFDFYADLPELDKRYKGKRYFSQFDLESCGADTACQAAHDFDANEWQFVEDCNVSDSCQEHVPTLTNCGENCSSQDYRHLDDLDAPQNNASLLGYFQYGEDYINQLDLELVADSLLVRAQMLEKDVLVQYFFKQPMNALKSLRENVIVGAERDVYDIGVMTNNSNVFINVLVANGVRNNECYRDYQRVDCALGTTTKGDPGECTLFDLGQGLCFSSYTEYESRALFCGATDLANGACIESALYTEESTRIGSANDAKWGQVNLSHQTSDQPGEILALVGDQSVASSDGKLGEGALLNPGLYRVDEATGDLSDKIGDITGRVETVIGGEVEASFSTVEVDTPVVRLDARIDIINYEENSLTESVLSKYALFNTVNVDNEAVQDAVIQRLGDALVVERTNSQIKSISASE